MFNVTPTVNVKVQKSKCVIRCMYYDKVSDLLYIRHWGTEKPEYHLEKSLHSEKVTVWAVLSKDGIIGPFFFEDQDGHAETINSELYLYILKQKCVPAFRRKGFSLDHIWFQQDSATPHTTSAVLDWINETFEDRVVSLKAQYAWPPHSPDLSPLDFYL